MQQHKRYVLLIKQCLQLAGYQTEEDSTSTQKIMVMFSSDNQAEIAETARRLKQLYSNTRITIHDTITGARVNVK